MTTPVPAAIGRRERKKAATRQAIADAALGLFLERGFDSVGIREIAELADVSTTTLFKYFPSKEALAFDLDASHEAALVAAVVERPEGQSIPAALKAFFIELLRGPRGSDPLLPQVSALIDGTPALREYAQRMWTRHETSLADAIAREMGAPSGDTTSRVLAGFVLQIPTIAQAQRNAEEAIELGFDILARGWPGGS